MWCCFAALGSKSLIFIVLVIYALDLLASSAVAPDEVKDQLAKLFLARLILTPTLFFIGFRIYKSKVTAAESNGYVDLESPVSNPPTVNPQSTAADTRAFIQYQKTLHEVKSRASFLSTCFAVAAFAVQTGCAVYIGISSVNFSNTSDRTGFIFAALIALVNAEYFLLKMVLDHVTEEHGENLPQLHLHPLFFTTENRMHRCDVCVERIKEEAYRCKTCDYDLCMHCYKKKRNANSTQPVIIPVSLTTFFIKSLKLSLAFWPLLIAAFLSMIACQSVSLLNPSVQGRVFDSIIQRDSTAFGRLILEYVIINVVLGLLGSLQSLSLELVGRRLNLAARQQLFASILRQDVAFFDSVHTGVLTSRMNNDVTAMVGPARTLLNDLLGNTILLIGAGALCLMTDWRLTVLALSSVTPITYGYNVYYQWSRLLNRTIWSSISDSNEVASESFSNFRTVRAFGAETLEISRFKDATNLANKAGTKAAMIGASVRAYSRYVDSAITVLVLWYGGKEALSNAFYGKTGSVESENTITLGKLIAFQLYWNILNSAFNSLSGVFGDLISASSAAERVYSVMDSVPEIDQEKGLIVGKSGDEVLHDSSPVVSSTDSVAAVLARESQDRVNWSISMSKVSFSYKMRPGTVVLDGVDLEIPTGRVTALVGQSGSGKSTLMHLLLRLYDPTDGQIFLSGRDLRSYSAVSIRHHIGLVSQDTQLFAASVFNNIIYGLNRPFTKDEVFEAAKQANAHEFISELDEGYETRIGEKGALLSGGQRQRIAIARCFLRKPKLLLLDEATSALDTENEALVQAAVDRLIANSGCTVVLIAHRLSTVMSAHNIAVMHKGKIVEQGAHEELVKKGGVYSRLVARQVRIESDRLEKQTSGPATVDNLFDGLSPE